MCVGYSPGIFYTGSVYTAARPAHPHWPCHVSVMSDCSLGTCRAPYVRRPSRASSRAASTSHTHIKPHSSHSHTRADPHTALGHKGNKGGGSLKRGASSGRPWQPTPKREVSQIREVYKQRSSRRSPRLSASAGGGTGGIAGGGERQSQLLLGILLVVVLLLVAARARGDGGLAATARSAGAQARARLCL